VWRAFVPLRFPIPAAAGLLVVSRGRQRQVSFRRVAKHHLDKWRRERREVIPQKGYSPMSSCWPQYGTADATPPPVWLRRLGWIKLVVPVKGTLLLISNGMSWPAVVGLLEATNVGLYEIGLGGFLFWYTIRVSCRLSSLVEKV